MLRLLALNWWVVVVQGVAAIAFGVAAFAWPRLTVLVLVTLFGVYALVDGSLALITSISMPRTQRRWWGALLHGIVSVFAGLYALISPADAALLLLALIAAWAILTGVFEIVAAIQLRHAIATKRLLAIAGLLSIALGVFLLAFPRAGILSLVWLIASYTAILGILYIVIGVRLRALQRAPGVD